MKTNELRFRFGIIALSFALHGCGANDVPATDSISDRLFNFGGLNETARRASLHWFSDYDTFVQVDELVTRTFGDLRFKAVATRKREHTSALKISSESFHLSYEDTPLCSGQIKVNTFGVSGKKVALAHLPSPDLTIVSDRTVDTFDIAPALAEALQQANIPNSDLEIVEENDCYYTEQNGLVRAKAVNFSASDLSYKAIVTASGVQSLQANFFDLTGKATVYASNPTDGVLKEYSLPGLTGDGSLENSYFTTSTTGTKAKEDDHVFNYDPDDGRFDETSLFVHANEQLSFFEGLGYKWSSDDKLNIIVHAVVHQSVNNALYTAATKTKPPMIQVGDGDGIRLKNLPKDADVVRHELGHHIVYDNLTSTSGESLVLHEGLADFFAFAFSDDACLGESICPAGSPINCEIEKKCLRTGDNNYVLNKNTKAEAHFKSQFISGMLWDIRSTIGKEKFTPIVYDGVSLLLEESGYHDFILGLLLAEDAAHGGKYCDEIYATAVARGLKSNISDFDCDNLPELSNRDNAGGETTSTTTTKRSSGGEGGLFGCGIIAGQAHQIPNLVLLMLGVLAPVFVRRRRA